MKTIGEIPELEGKKVLVRVDFNVPVENNKVLDDFRIRMALPTIDFLRHKGAKIILISHLEASDGENLSLKPIVDSLANLGHPVQFVSDLKEAALAGKAMKEGDVILLENLRNWSGEKENDPTFALELASLGEIYVNEAFPVSHRSHASIVGIAAILPGFAGLQLQKEVANLSKAFEPEHPFIFILNGAKFQTKLPLLEKFLITADMVFVGGALSSDFFKKKGYEVGRSLVSDGDFDLDSYLKNPKLLLPTDVMDQDKKVYSPENFPSTGKIVDVGEETMELLRDKIGQSKFILWNGPLGLYEEGFDDTTLELAQIVAQATQKGSTSIVGGGDTVAAIEKLHIGEKFTFMSSGGGAMLDFLAKGTLPGLQALEKSPSIA